MRVTVQQDVLNSRPTKTVERCDRRGEKRQEEGGQSRQTNDSGSKKLQ